ncbi:hypothetical protein AVEN_193405-1 [Araneus ventricosus]|uniref:Uncharacterized protein n=1 Tax=Araneus ventricosus TaxID=182803 RepID=A0A4Y2F8T8_ARAVE|nr:hypothetical protein AVEN_193405-1 [Araneus ventricosus]
MLVGLMKYKSASVLSSSGVEVWGVVSKGLGGLVLSFWAQFSYVLMSRSEATQGLFWEKPRNLELWSDDKNDTLTGTTLSKISHHTSEPVTKMEGAFKTSRNICDTLTQERDYN